jgi:hypothetical protein
LYHVLEVVRGKFPFDKLKDKIIEVKQRYGKAASLVIEESPISHGLTTAGFITQQKFDDRYLVLTLVHTAVASCLPRLC